MRAMLVVILALGAPIVLGARVRAAEQTVTPLTPTEEQQVVAIDGGGATQGVQAVEGQALEEVVAKTPPGPVAKAASVVGKVALTIFAVGVAIAASAASLLLL